MKHPIHTPAASRVLQTHSVLPTDTNALGMLFGGRLVEWIDVAAGIACQRHSRHRVVTASIDDLHFLQPIRVGMIVELLAQVNATWRTSMEAGVRIESEHPRTGKRVHACTAYLSYVAQDEEGHHLQIPQIVLENEDDKRRHLAAGERRALRLSRSRMRREQLDRHPARPISPAADAKTEDE